MNWLIRLRGGFWWCTLLILTVLSMPRFGGDEGALMWTNGIYNAVIILVVFPLIVSIGAGSSVTGSRSSAINRFLGDVFVAVCVFVASILLAYATYRLYDLPVRERLIDVTAKVQIIFDIIASAG